MCPLPTTLNSGLQKKNEGGQRVGLVSIVVWTNGRGKKSIPSQLIPHNDLGFFLPLSPWVLVKLVQYSKCLTGWPLVLNEVLTNTDEDFDTGTHHATYNLLLIQHQLSISAKSILLFLCLFLALSLPSDPRDPSTCWQQRKTLPPSPRPCWRLEATVASKNMEPHKNILLTKANFQDTRNNCTSCFYDAESQF